MAFLETPETDAFHMYLPVTDQVLHMSGPASFQNPFAQDVYNCN